MVQPLTAEALFEAHKDKLLLDWLAGFNGKDRLITDDDKQLPHVSLIGHLNAIHPNQIQILGPWELEYLNHLGKNTHHDVIEQLFANHPAAIIVTDGLLPEPALIKLADDSDTPLFASSLKSHKLINILQRSLERHLAEVIVLHGVFMEVYGTGVLLRGESGIGKSELALELINRGHRLIADDAPQFARITPDAIRGHCPEALQNFLEVRGLGILNIRDMFGDSAIKPAKNLQLIALTPFDNRTTSRIYNPKAGHQSKSLVRIVQPNARGSCPCVTDHINPMGPNTFPTKPMIIKCR